MNNVRTELRLGRSLAAALMLAWAHAAIGQTFSSGSTGADGAFNPPVGTTNVTVRPGGVYNYTTVDIPRFATVAYFKNSDNAPVVILATGDVTITGTLSLNGADGFGPSAIQNVAPGGQGGPGGFKGGDG